MSVPVSLRYRGVYINGEWRDMAPGERSFKTENPFTGEAVLEVHPADVPEVDDAVESAHRAFLSWRALTHDQRAEYLLKLKEELLNLIKKEK